MKHIYIIATLIPLIFTSCSSTYKVSDFPSKDKFFEDFNKSAYDKSLQVTLNNDSSFTNNNGAEIVNDTLYCLNIEIESINKKISLSDIKEIKYSGSNFRKGLILLRDGKTFDAEEIDIYNDTVKFSYINTINSHKCSLSMNKVREVSYKNHWLGVPIPLITGTAAGIAAGGLSAFVYDSSINTNDKNSIDAGIFLGIASLGMIIGGIDGWINGYTYIYQFSP
jgi:hypothetical protein